jgi:hypothetical protein
MGGRLARCVAAGLLLLAASVAVGQIGPARDAEGLKAAFPDPYFRGTLAAAHRAAKSQHRMLIIFMHDDRGEEPMLKNAWPSPYLATWIQWHAILFPVRWADALPELRNLAEKVEIPYGKPVSFIFVDGKSRAMWWHTDPETIAGVVQKFRDKGFFRGARKGLLYDPSVPGLEDGTRFVSLNALGPLFNGQLALEAMKSADPVWLAMHYRKNPGPDEPPRPDFFHKQDDGLAAAFLGPVPGLSGATQPGVKVPAALSVVREARELVRAGDLFAAAGRYTWLWEVGLTGDAVLEPLRLTLLASEMQEVARRRPGTRERFRAMRDGLTPRVLWFDPGELDEWFRLNAIIDDEAMTGEHVGMFLADEREAGMMPQAEQAGLRSMLARSPLEWPGAINGRRADAVAQAHGVSRLNERLGVLRRQAARGVPIEPAIPAREARPGDNLFGPREPTVAQERAKFAVLHRGVMVGEAAALYARATVLGQSAIADEAAAIALRFGGAQAGATLVAALAWVQAGGDPADAINDHARHSGWLDRAGEAGVDVEPLRAPER